MVSRITYSIPYVGFSDNVEDAYGHFGYLGFHIASGVASSLFWLVKNWGDTYQSVGP